MGNMRSSDPVATLKGLQAVEVDAADAAVCARLLGDTRRLRGWIDAFEASVGSRLRTLQDQTGSAPAADLHAKCGGVSAGEARRKQRRSEILDAVPSFADALASGQIGAEHVDALANATTKLDDDLKARFLKREHELLEDARVMSPERFARSCRDRVRRLEKDRGIERNRQQRQATYLSRKTNMVTGMVEGRFAFHPELANQIFGALDKQVAAMIKRGETAGDPDFTARTIDRNRLTAPFRRLRLEHGFPSPRPGRG